MNKFTKGAISGAAGIALLLGGVGSFALWNDSASVNAGTITSGTLAFAPVANAGTWTNTAANGTVTTITPADLTNHPIVPGDTLTYTRDIDITAHGDDLKANLKIDTSGVRFGNPGNTALASSLSQHLSLSVVSATDPSALPNNVVKTNDFTYTVTSAANTTKLKLTATFAFPFGTTVDNSTQNGTLDLTNLSVSLNQIHG